MSRILIVEDNEKSRYLLEQILLSGEHEVTVAENGAIALVSAQRNRPELIISDIMMPVMNGFRLCREVRNDPRLKDIPFVFYTATFTDQVDERLALGLGADRFLLKPLDAADLLKIIDDILGEVRSSVQTPLPVPLDDTEALLKMYDNSITRKLTEKVEDLQAGQEALYKSEQRLKEAQELAQVGHWEFDLRSKEFQWSEEVCRIFNLQLKNLTVAYAELLDRVHPDDRSLVEKSFKLLLTQNMGYDITYRLCLQGEASKFVHERGQILCDDNGTPKTAIGTVQDVTEQKELEQKLHQSQKMEVIGTMAGGIAHDFNNIFWLSTSLQQ